MILMTWDTTLAADEANLLAAAHNYNNWANRHNPDLIANLTAFIATGTRTAADLDGIAPLSVQQRNAWREEERRRSIPTTTTQTPPPTTQPLPTTTPTTTPTPPTQTPPTTTTTTTTTPTPPPRGSTDMVRGLFDSIQSANVSTLQGAQLEILDALERGDEGAARRIANRIIQDTPVENPNQYTIRAHGSLTSPQEEKTNNTLGTMVFYSPQGVTIDTEEAGRIQHEVLQRGFPNVARGGLRYAPDVIAGGRYMDMNFSNDLSAFTQDDRAHRSGIICRNCQLAAREWREVANDALYGQLREGVGFSGIVGENEPGYTVDTIIGHHEYAPLSAVPLIFSAPQQNVRVNIHRIPGMIYDFDTDVGLTLEQSLDIINVHQEQAHGDQTSQNPPFRVHIISCRYEGDPNNPFLIHNARANFTGSRAPICGSTAAARRAAVARGGACRVQPPIGRNMEPEPDARPGIDVDAVVCGRRFRCGVDQYAANTIIPLEYGAGRDGGAVSDDEFCRSICANVPGSLHPWRCDNDTHFCTRTGDVDVVRQPRQRPVTTSRGGTGLFSGMTTTGGSSSGVGPFGGFYSDSVSQPPPGGSSSVPFTFSGGGGLFGGPTPFGGGGGGSQRRTTGHRNTRTCEQCSGQRQVWSNMAKSWLQCPRCGGSGRMN